MSRKSEAEVIASLKGDELGEAKYIADRVKALQSKIDRLIGLSSSSEVRAMVERSIRPQETPESGSW